MKLPVTSPAAGLSRSITPGREELADLLGPLGVAVDVLGQRRVLAAAVPLQELLGEPFDRVAIVAGVGHGNGPLGTGAGRGRMRPTCRAARLCRSKFTAADQIAEVAGRESLIDPEAEAGSRRACRPTAPAGAASLPR